MRTDPHPTASLTHDELAELATTIKLRGIELGFQQVGIADTNLSEAETLFETWLEKGFHGEMAYMSHHGKKRTQPESLVPGTVRVISVRMDYWPQDSADAESELNDAEQAYISRYAVGRDYHEVLRERLRMLAKFIQEKIGSFGYRVFVDSAPVLEKPLAHKAGLGWIGKHTNLIHPKAGSWFFLGELFTDLPLPVDSPIKDHCGSCSACIEVCPTGAIIAPYVLDAQRCISYLTIELRGSIPEELRTGIGNRIFGCDDCQMVCPWNKFAQPGKEKDFSPRHSLDSASLVMLFRWDEAEWNEKTQNSALRRAGYEGWLRNLAVALGNSPSERRVISALHEKADHPSELVREHVHWALAQHKIPSNS